MKLNKYSETKNGSVTVGSYSDRRSPSVTSPATSPAPDRLLWGQEDSGGDIDGSMLVNGNMYVGELQYDDEEKPAVPDHEFPSESGNMFAEKTFESPEVFGHSLFLNVDGKMTNILDLLLPVGSVIMFDGKSKIPDNWAICNGQNGTPDLRGKFVRGGSDFTAGQSGGSSTVTLTEDNLPSHSHSTSVSTKTSRDNDLTVEQINKYFVAYSQVETEVFDKGGDTRYTVISGWDSPTDKGMEAIPVRQVMNQEFKADVSVTVNNAGAGKSFDITPPFYTLVFIMRIR